MSSNRSRSWRIAILTLVVIVTVVIVVPAIILLATYATGLDKCEGRAGESGSFVCSAQGRVLVALVLIGIGIPLVRRWIRFVTRKLSPAGKPEQK